MSYSYQPRAESWVFKKDSGEAARCWKGWAQRTTHQSEERGHNHFEEFCQVAARVPVSPIVWELGERKEKFYKHADFCVLDFDEGPTIEEMHQTLEDTMHGIITTYSHDHSVKRGGPHKFRLIVPWSKRITDKRVYKWNTLKMAEKYGADTAATDAARFFFPGVDVEHFHVGEGMYVFDVIGEEEIPNGFDSPIDVEKYRGGLIHEKSGQLLLEPHVAGFLTHGTTFGAGRNQSVFITAKIFSVGGISQAECERIISNSPFDRNGFNEFELKRTIESAYIG